MTLVIVVQVKSLKNVVEPYKRKVNNNVKDKIVIIAIDIFFLELNIS